MKVFISWSGPRGAKMAEALDDFLRRVIQAVEPFISSEIEKGARWREQVSGALEEATFGVVCVTRDSIASEWLHFEAGALSSKANLWTLLLDVNPTDLKDPLGQFQHTMASDREDVYRFFQQVNTRVSKPVRSEDLRKLFDAFWPEFEGAIEAVPATRVKPVQRSVEEMFEEIHLLERRE